MTDPTRAVWNILTNGAPLPPKPNDLPTEPGLYIVRQEFHSENWWAAAVFRRTLQGFWEMDRNPITVDELVTILGPRALVRLIPATEADK